MIDAKGLDQGTNFVERKVLSIEEFVSRLLKSFKKPLRLLLGCDHVKRVAYNQDLEKVDPWILSQTLGVFIEIVAGRNEEVLSEDLRSSIAGGVRDFILQRLYIALFYSLPETDKDKLVYKSLTS